MVHALFARERGGPKSHLLPARPGKTAVAVRAVVLLREEPIRMFEIHAAVESLLGEPVSRAP